MMKKVLIEIPTETLSNVQNGTMDMADVMYALRAITGGEEQKVGKWRTEVDYGNHLHCYCPFCRHEGLGVRQKYCYECGAKMEGADNE